MGVTSMWAPDLVWMALIVAPGIGLSAQGAGCRVQGAGFRVQGSGFKG